MSLTPREIDRLLARLRTGDSLSLTANGGRYTLELSCHEDGAFVWDEFDEGTTARLHLDEAAFREALQRAPEDELRRAIEIG